MDFAPKFLFFLFFLRTVSGQFAVADSVGDPEEKSRQMQIVQHKQTREIIQSELEENFRKVQNLLRNLTESFGQQLQRSDSKLKGEIGSLSETLLRNHQQLSSSISNLTASFNSNSVTTEDEFTQVVVEEINLERGMIEFDGAAKLNLNRKIWVFQSEGGNTDRHMTFVLEKNRLGKAARLFLWGPGNFAAFQHMWNGSQRDSRKERASWGNMFLLTLVISPSSVETPSFSLKFNTTSASARGQVYSSELVIREGHQFVTFPPNNAKNYTPGSLFVALIAPPSGRSFALTLKYLDLPATPIYGCHHNNFRVWLLEESSTGFHFTQLTSSDVRPCGSFGNISEHLGYAAIAILQFLNKDLHVGTGFRVEVN